MESSAHDPGAVAGALSADDESTPPGARLEDLELRLGHSFADIKLLEQALTHRSLTRDTPRNGGAGPLHEDNERMEFLGDAVVGLTAAAALYRRYPELSEGDLTRLRGALVNRRHLAQVARDVELGRHLLLGKGEERGGGRRKPVLLANAMEAVLGAVFLDAGLDAVQRVVERLILSPSAEALRRQLVEGGGIGDYKSGLQELLQARRLGQPEYCTTTESGPDHRKEFRVEVRCGGRALASGTGSNRKQAEQDAARQALEMLRERAE
jgi:ribonuclease-3